MDVTATMKGLAITGTASLDGVVTPHCLGNNSFYSNISTYLRSRGLALASACPQTVWCLPCS